MAGFNIEFPTELMSSIKKLTDESDTMFKEMTQAGAKVVYNNVKSNMKSSFIRTECIEK